MESKDVGILEETLGVVRQGFDELDRRQGPEAFQQTGHRTGPGAVYPQYEQ